MHRRLGISCALALLACHHEPPPHTTATLAHPVAPQSSVPALFRSIPADTPFLFASLDGIPPDVVGAIVDRVAPLGRELVEEDRRKQSPDLKMTDAILGELAGKWNAAGIESLGFLARPRFALYGLGVEGFVLRLEIRDEQLLIDTMRRIATRGGESWTEPVAKGNVRYWRSENKDMSAIMMVADHQFVAAVGEHARIDEDLDVILGIKPPHRAMADAAPLLRVMKEHGFPGTAVGYMDTRLMLREAVATNKEPTSDACYAELDRLANRAPRFVLGFHELTTQKATLSAVIELAPDLVSELAAMRIEVPGLALALEHRPLMAAGGGIDLAAAKEFFAEALASWDQAAHACKPGESDRLGRIYDALGRPLPPPFDNITGGVFAMQRMVMAPGAAAPEQLDGALAITARDPDALFAMLRAFDPSMAALATDGKLHEIVPPTPSPLKFFGTIAPHAIMLAVGTEGADLAARMLEAPAAKAPFAIGTMNARSLVELGTRMNPDGFGNDPAERAAIEVLQAMGQLTAAFDVTAKGLAFSVSIEPP